MGILGEYLQFAPIIYIWVIQGISGEDLGEQTAGVDHPDPAEESRRLGG